MAPYVDEIAKARKGKNAKGTPSETPVAEVVRLR